MTFNNAVGLPEKEGREYPLFDYEKLLYDTLQSNKHVWIKKATGLGVTEFMLRYMAWLCTKDDNLRGSQMCIVTGPRIELAITLIDRLKGLFQKLGIIFDTKETVVELNGVHVEAFPSHHLDTMRGLTNVSFIYLDEADFFPPGQQQDARTVSERYIAKSNPWIVMVSTPNKPGGLFERIEQEPENECLYERIQLDYTYGVGKIYTEQEIINAKRSPSFEQEYNLKYLGLIGNVFHTKDIETAKDKGTKYEPGLYNPYTQKSMGIDPGSGFGASNFGICITEIVDGICNVVFAEEYTRPDFDQMIQTTVNLIRKYDMHLQNHCHIYVDGANPIFIRALKAAVHEDIDYDGLLKILRSNTGNNPMISDLQLMQWNMLVIPIAFGKYGKEMLAHSKEIMEYQGGRIAINPKHDKLITALRTAVENGEGGLDKEATTYHDVFDAFRLSLMAWKFH